MIYPFNKQEMKITDFLNRNKELAFVKTDDLYEEINRRNATENPFPIHVFHEKIKNFINGLCSSDGFDLPPSFIGTALLTAYSSAIGTSYKVSTNGKDGIYLIVWSCLLGISSSGKSLAINKILAPLMKIQEQFDTDWENETKGMSDSQIAKKRIPTLLFRDIIMQTLVKSIIPDNPKGVLKIADELLEWINGMNQMSNKEGTDEQFWMSTWNCSSYSGIRAGKQKFINKRPFVNVIGGTQHKVLPRFFAKDRDTSGFIFRLLFAKTVVDRIAQPNSLFQMPEEMEWLHNESLKTLYFNLQVEKDGDPPKLAVLSDVATKLYDDWVNSKINEINRLEDINEKNTRASILGKIKEYILRFAGILALSDKCLSAPIVNNKLKPFFFDNEKVDFKIMERALLLGQYYYFEAIDIYSTVQNQIVAPKEVLVTSYLLKSGKHTNLQIGKLIYDNPKNVSDPALKKRMERNIKKWIIEYPKVFGAISR